MTDLKIPEIKKQHLIALQEVIVIMQRAIDTDDWDDLATADTFLNRIEDEVRGYSDEDADELMSIRFGFSGADKNDWETVERHLHHLCLVVGLEYPIRFFTKDQAAQYLGLKEVSVRMACQRGQLHKVFVGSFVIFYIEELRRYRRENLGKKGRSKS